MQPDAADPAPFDAAMSNVDAGVLPDPMDAAVEAAAPEIDAAIEPSDGAVPSDAAVIVVDPCELEITAPRVEDDSPLNCRGETLKPEDEELTWLGLWAEQAEQRVFVYWDYDELWSGATVELPLANSDNGNVTVDYFTSDGSMWRADRGTIQLLHSGAGTGHYIVALQGVRFDALPGLEINGAIGAKLEHYVCIICQ